MEVSHRDNRRPKRTHGNTDGALSIQDLSTHGRTERTLSDDRDVGELELRGLLEMVDLDIYALGLSMCKSGKMETVPQASQKLGRSSNMTRPPVAPV